MQVQQTTLKTTEKDFCKYDNAILIKETFYATGASCKIVGGGNGFYDKEHIYNIWLEIDDKAIRELPLSEYDNTYLCIVGCYICIFQKDY